MSYMLCLQVWTSENLLFCSLARVSFDNSVYVEWHRCSS